MLASDGVWEFLSNDEVCSIVYPCWLQGSPEVAAERVIKESLLKWKSLQDIVDDITVIVVFLKNHSNVEGLRKSTAAGITVSPANGEAEEQSIVLG